MSIPSSRMFLSWETLGRPTLVTQQVRIWWVRAGAVRVRVIGRVVTRRRWAATLLCLSKTLLGDSSRLSVQPLS